MKKYNIAIQTPHMTIWDYDAIPDTIEAEDETEAIELAKEYLRECCINNRCDPDVVDTWKFVIY